MSCSTSRYSEGSSTAVASVREPWYEGKLQSRSRGDGGSRIVLQVVVIVAKVAMIEVVAVAVIVVVIVFVIAVVVVMVVMEQTGG